MREQLLDRMIKIYGYEHEVVIEFANLCEKEWIADRDLETIVKTHEAMAICDEDED